MLFPLPIHWGSFQVHQLQLVSQSLSCSIVFFLILWQGLEIYLSFSFLLNLLCGLPRWLIPLISRFSFFSLVDCHYIWSSDRYYVIYLYLKIPEKCVRLILQDGFRIVSILLFREVKFKFLAQFPVDHLPHPVVSSLVLF